LGSNREKVEKYFFRDFMISYLWEWGEGGRERRGGRKNNFYR